MLYAHFFIHIHIYVFIYINTHTHTHKHIYIYTYIYTILHPRSISTCKHRSRGRAVALERLLVHDGAGDVLRDAHHRLGGEVAIRRGA